MSDIGPRHSKAYQKRLAAMAKARVMIADAISAAEREHKITIAEMTVILAEVLRTWVAYPLAEQHKMVNDQALLREKKP